MGPCRLPFGFGHKKVSAQDGDGAAPGGTAQPPSCTPLTQVRGRVTSPSASPVSAFLIEPPRAACLSKQEHAFDHPRGWKNRLSCESRVEEHTIETDPIKYDLEEFTATGKGGGPGRFSGGGCGRGGCGAHPKSSPPPPPPHPPSSDRSLVAIGGKQFTSNMGAGQTKDATAILAELGQSHLMAEWTSETSG